jgi:hypothetical protein
MEETQKTNHELESVGRRKVVKKIVGGVTALAAYNLLPVRWGKPIIEQVFLPAHAQTSGEVVEEAPAPEPPPQTTISITNNSSGEVDVDYTNPSGTSATGIVPAGSSLSVQARPGSYMEIYPVGHVTYRTYVGGGAASSLITEDRDSPSSPRWPDNHFQGNLGSGDTGTVTVTDPPS